MPFLLLTCVCLGTISFLPQVAIFLTCAHLQACCHYWNSYFLCELKHGTESSWSFCISPQGSHWFLKLFISPLQKTREARRTVVWWHPWWGVACFCSLTISPPKSSFSRILPGKYLDVGCKISLGTLGILVWWIGAVYSKIDVENKGFPIQHIFSSCLVVSCSAWHGLAQDGAVVCALSICGTPGLGWVLDWDVFWESILRE